VEESTSSELGDELRYGREFEFGEDLPPWYGGETDEDEDGGDYDEVGEVEVGYDDEFDYDDFQEVDHW